MTQYKEQGYYTCCQAEKYGCKKDSDCCSDSSVCKKTGYSPCGQCVSKPIETADY
jgi:hypothetical protein